MALISLRSTKRISSGSQSLKAVIKPLFDISKKAAAEIRLCLPRSSTRLEDSQETNIRQQAKNESMTTTKISLGINFAPYITFR
jgi:hypothetical protein